MPKKKTTTKKKTGSKKIGAAGKTIMNMAKAIRKQAPGKKWTTCVKEAGKQYKKTLK